MEFSLSLRVIIHLYSAYIYTVRSIYLISLLGAPRPSLKQVSELRGTAESEPQVRAAAVVAAAVPPRPNAEGGGRASAPLRDRRRAPRRASRTRRGGVVHRATDSAAVARRVRVRVHVRGLGRRALEAAPPRARPARPIGGAPSGLPLRPHRHRHRREAAARTGTTTDADTSPRLGLRGLVSRSVHRPRRLETSRAIEPRLRATDALSSKKLTRNWKRRRTPQDAAALRLRPAPLLRDPHPQLTCTSAPRRCTNYVDVSRPDFYA